MLDIQKYCIDNNLTVSTIESCTSGLLANKLTSFSESSKFFKGSVIAYNDQIKEQLLKIDKKLIKKYTSVSKEVVLEMAISGKNIFSTDICISVTGYHDPKGKTYAYACIFFKEPHVIKILLTGDTRELNRLQIVNSTIRNLREILL
jgi:PncC family amidohydrolase